VALSPGARLGPYEILSVLGAGGMGEVYRARDGTLQRDVALKILPDHFAFDPERLARFRREARVLAALNHPNIAAIYGFEESTNIHALVLELVEGPTLADRIAQGPIPVHEALPIARQIAEALEAAHEQGIVHRDLKPANIKVRADGTAKVLDFGLAKAAQPKGTAGHPDVSASATVTSPAMMTAVGVILGTAAYMSPEQAKGREADKRSDIWAFGCVLYEMLTGRRPFDGEDMTDVLGAVVRLEPRWEALSSDVPRAVRTLLQQCLVKDRLKRVADIAAARFVLDHQANVETTAEEPAKLNQVPWLIAGLATVGAIAVGIVALRGVGDVPPTPDPLQFTIEVPENASFGGPVSGGTGTAAQIAVSPDGRNIVFVAGAPSAYQLWLRSAAAASARPMAGTEGGTFPFWSPDGRFVGFFADGKLKKVAIAGGPPIVLCDAPIGRGGSWSQGNVILWARAGSDGGIMRVSDAGGVPVTVTMPTDGEDAHRWPHFLPDGQHFLYTAVTGGCCPPPRPGTVKVASLDRTESVVSLLQADSSAGYASGHLLFARDQTLMAQPFDADARQLTGEAFPLAERISTEGSRYTSASASANGTLVYVHEGSPSPLQLTWFDRAGRTLGTLGDGAADVNPALSPDERQVAIAFRSGSPENLDIWTIDVARNLRSRATFDPGPEGWPVWSPDGKRIVFGNGGQDFGELAEKALVQQIAISGAATSETLLEATGTPSRPCGARQCTLTPTAWSEDGRFVLYTFAGSFPRTSDIWALPLFGDRKPFPVAETGFNEEHGVFSPDGGWIAFTTDETGQTDVYVQPFLREGGKHRISPTGGRNPRWRADSKELFYVDGDGTMMAVPIEGSAQLEIGMPQALFSAAASGNNYSYVVTRDGQRFLVNARPPGSGSAESLTVVVNWPATLQK